MTNIYFTLAMPHVKCNEAIVKKSDRLWCTAHIPRNDLSLHIPILTDNKASIRWQDSAPPISDYWPTSEPNAG